MRFIINNKLYDTEKAELICSYNASIFESCDIYRTEKGNYFQISGLLTKDCQSLTVDQVKERLIYNGYIDKYIELFGIPEEA